jgi:hypothetical protein
VCCFSRPVRAVTNTRIFARALPGGRQALVYGMRLAIDEDVAMVLPIPVAAGTPEDGVSFVDLSGYPTLLDDLDRCAPEEQVARGVGPQPAPRAKLVVQAVGAFEASFAPTVGDLDRLDERFRLPRAVWAALPEVADRGFVVFKLRPEARGWLGRLVPAPARDAHPMAFVFPSRAPDALFFPTLHVHDGAAHPTATFDHALFWQGPTGGDRAAPPEVVARHVGFDRAAGLVAPGAALERRTIRGEHPNRDVWVGGPP